MSVPSVLVSRAVGCAFTLALSLFFISPALAEDRKGFVEEYLRETSGFNALRLSANKNNAIEPGEVVSNCIREMTTFQLEIGGYVRQLDSYKLSGEFSDLPTLIKRTWEQQSSLYGEFEKYCEKMASFKPGTDYSTVGVETPKITARLEFAEKNFIQIGTMVALSLVGSHTNSQGKLDRLILTSDERQAMIEEIQHGFPNLELKDSPAIVTSAWLIRSILRNHRAYKSADEA